MKDKSVDIIGKSFLIRVFEALATGGISEITFITGTGTTNAELLVTGWHTYSQVILIDPFEDKARTRLSVDVVDDPHGRA